MLTDDVADGLDDVATLLEKIAPMVTPGEAKP